MPLCRAATVHPQRILRGFLRNRISNGKRQGFWLNSKLFFSSSTAASPFVTREIASDDQRRITRTTKRCPRAIVLILGFGGSTPRILAKYADLYHQMGCSTVSGTASNSLVFARGNHHRMEHMDSFARSAIQNVSGMVRSQETGNDRRIPVAMHILSNGGAFVARRIGVLLTDAATNNTTDVGNSHHRKEDYNEDYDDDLLLFADRLRNGYQLFDSAPCYPTLKGSLTVIRRLFSNPWIGSPLSYLFALRTVLVPTSISFLTGLPTQGDLFWSGLLDDSTLCPRQAFVYTVRDEISDAGKIEDFCKAIREKQQQFAVGGKGLVRTMHLEDSRHVQHLRLHPEQYSDFVETLLKDVEESEDKQ